MAIIRQHEAAIMATTAVSPLPVPGIVVYGRYRPPVWHIPHPALLLRRPGTTPYVESRGYLELWTRAQLAYYRPLNFHLWKLFYDLLGEHNRLVNHGLNLLLHATNGWLVGWLAWKVWPRKQADQYLRPFLSATLFLFFPFSYQGVPWVGSLNHLLAIFLMLLSLAAYLLWRQNGRRCWLFGGLLAALLAPFAHENGILVGPLVALLIFTDTELLQKQTAVFKTAPKEMGHKPHARLKPLKKLILIQGDMTHS
ncbi:MAG: hypothetical protein R3E31_16090 [Chloroflexota bacterium]